MICITFIASLAASISPLAVAAAEPPPVFGDLGFEEARQMSSQIPGGLLVLDAMTSWCGPCKVMDKTTWRDPSLVEWMKSNTVSIQLDMDEHTELKESLEIAAYPTIVVFRGGDELDRVVGSRDAAFMRDWLRGLAEGRVRKDTVAAAWAEAMARADLGMVERLSLVLDLLEVGLAEEARDGCVALWNEREDWPKEMRDRGVYSLLYGSLELARSNESMHQAMCEVADSMAPQGAPEWVPKWVMIEKGLGRIDRVVDFARAATGDEAGRALLARGGRSLFDLLVAEGAWAEAGHALPDPVGAVTNDASWREVQKRSGSGMMLAMPMMTAETAGLSVDEVRDRSAEDRSSRIFAALLAAGRDKEAGEVAMVLLAHIDRPRARVSLVARALDAGQIDPDRDGKWLAEALSAKPVVSETSQGATEAASFGGAMTPAKPIGGG